MRDAIYREIDVERERQINVERFTAAHDDVINACGELAHAAACYAIKPRLEVMAVAGLLKILWPWSWTWWKPKDRRQELVVSAALIVAEIERLDRAEANKVESPEGEDTFA